jgi:hypothetical protein
MMTCCPSRADSGCTTTRASAVIGEPATSGITSLIGLSGYCCACAGDAPNPAARIATIASARSRIAVTPP